VEIKLEVAVLDREKVAGRLDHGRTRFDQDLPSFSRKAVSHGRGNFQQIK
jgi:hypothetical protein